MILVVLFIGAILLVSALRNTYGMLFSDLGQDVPKFVTWAAAILALGALGFIPGLKPISRGLMGLVLLVIIFQNYENILKGFQSVAVVQKSGTGGGSGGNSGSGGSAGATGSGETSGPLSIVVRGATPDYSGLDYVTPPSAFSSSSIGH